MTATTAMAALVACAAAGAAVGGTVAWWLHRRTAVSPHCLYLAGGTGPIVLLAALALLSPVLLVLAALWTSAGVVGAALGRRWRLAALGAGGELREYEQARTGLVRGWQRRRRGTAANGRTYIASQGELIREREWPATEPSVPMSATGAGRLPRRAGRHLLIAGATGSGKTVSARRWLLARILADGVGVLVTDPKGDRDLESDLRAGARLARRPFVLFDPRDPDTDRWNPLWSEDTGAAVSRLVAPIQAAEGNARYYADLLQIHLGTVAEGLRAAGLWPASLPLLLDACQLHAYDQLLALVRSAGDEHAGLIARMREHRQVITDPAGRRDLLGGTTRLRVVAGETWRTTLTPEPERGAVCLPDALRAGAVVLLRTWVDDLPEEAKAITSLFLADAAASALALPAGTEWAALIDEFGGVLSSGAGERALALMQRARSAGGQVAISTQSVIDFAASTGNTALLDALADNFSAGVFHRQSSPESRDWLARLIGTREVWQLTDRTAGGGSYAEGSGSRRRVREFLIRPDDFRTLDTGQAVIWTTLGPAPEHITVNPAQLPAQPPDAVDPGSVYRPCGPTRLPKQPARKSSALDEKAATSPALDL
jgi:TraM recognition site of TraD and TraG/Type IV secretion-system coupling protein DNA-binding domain